VIAAVSAICLIFPLGILDVAGGIGVVFLIVTQLRDRRQFAVRETAQT
jgi:hypothetical protein